MRDDPSSRGDARGPRTPFERVFLAACVIAFFGAIVWEVAREADPRRLAGVFFFLAWGPLLVLHEAGHAIAAHLVGFRIERVVLGFGARRATLDVLGVPVELRTLPLTGFVATAPARGRGGRLAHAFVYAAGPGAELALAAAIVAAVGPRGIFALTDDVRLVALQAIAAAAATGAILNLFPGSTAGARGAIPTDGLGILHALFGRRT